MKVLKNNIAGLKTRKGIEKSPQNSRFVRAGLGADPHAGSSGSRAEFQCHQPGGHIGEPALRKRNRQPEKGASPEIKGKGACHIAAQVNQRIPQDPSAAHSAVGKNKKGYLLDIVIPVIKKQALSVN